MNRAAFTLDDFMSQMGRVKELGPTGKVMGMVAGMSALAEKLGMNARDVERQMGRMRAIYDSMTTKERADTDLLGPTRRRRVARGAGVPVTDVSQFIRQFELSRDMMHRVGTMTSAHHLGLVLGLVTDRPAERDPSLVFPAGPAHRRQQTLAACLLALAVAAFLLWRSAFWMR